MQRERGNGSGGWGSTRGGWGSPAPGEDGATPAPGEDGAAQPTELGNVCHEMLIPAPSPHRAPAPSVPALPSCSERNQISSATSGYGAACSVNVILLGIIMESTHYQK